MNDLTVKPISILKSIWYFVVSSLMINIGVYYLIPMLMENEIPFLAGYFIFFYFPLALMFFAALVLYKIEGNAWRIADFKRRMRINPLKKADWLWIAILIAGYFALLLLLTPLTNRIAQIPLFSPPDFFPSEINPNKVSTPGYAWGYELSGQFWVVIVYFVGWFFNIFGEELLFRGMLLPRQVEKYGAKAWIYHGIIWGLWHCFWKWQLVLYIPFTLLFSYAVYKRKNTSIGIIAHGILNFIPLISIIIGVTQRR